MIPRSPLHIAVFDQAAADPSRVALQSVDSSITFAQVERSAINLAEMLYQSNIRAGDYVAFLASRSEVVAELFVACSLMGYVVVPLNPATKPATIRAVARAYGVKATLVTGEWAELVKSLARSEELGTILLAPDRAERYKFPNRRSLPRSGEDSLDVAMTKVLYVNSSSGSTGVPKGLLATQQQIWINTMAAVESLGLNADDTHFCAFPAYLHTHELFVRGLCTGAKTVLIGENLGHRATIEVLDRASVSRLHASPSYYRQMIAIAQRMPREMLARVKTAESGGMKTADQLAQDFEDRFGCYLSPVWGSTETTGVAIGGPERSKGNGCVGLPRAYYEVEIRDDRGQSAPVGSVGELVIRSTAVSSSSEQVEELSQNGETDHVREVRTGDLAYCDSNGRVYIRGRMDELVKVNGLNVWLPDIDRVIITHPGVADCVSVVSDDDDRGSIVQSLVVVSPGASVERGQLLHHCHELLEPHAVPREINFVGKAPRTATGKAIRWKSTTENVEIE